MALGLPVMRNALIYVLLVLLAWGWVDDLAIASVQTDLQQNSVSWENDEYLASAQPLRHKERGDGPRAMVASLSSCLDWPTFPLTGDNLPTSNHLAVSATDPLYAFMSLQR